MANSRLIPLSLTHAHYLVLRPSLGLKVAGDTQLFNKGDILSGVLGMHPLNSARKVLIHTKLGVFNFNAEDIREVNSAPQLKP